MATIPLSLLSKFPQIYENQRARSTGQLSAVAVFSQIAGCLARLFTTATEVGDPIVFAGFLLALLLNLIVGAQMYAFWGREGDDRVLGRLLRKRDPLRALSFLHYHHYHLNPNHRHSYSHLKGVSDGQEKLTRTCMIWNRILGTINLVGLRS